MLAFTAATPSQISPPPPAPNAGWSMSRLKRVMRWGVYACTLFLLLLLALSHVRILAYAEATVNAQTWSRTSFGVDRGMLWLGYTPECRSCWGTKHAVSSHAFLNYPANNELAQEFFYMKRGLGGRLVIGSTAGTEYVYSASLWIPSAAFMCSTVLMWWRLLKRRRPGTCQSCGYPLVDLPSETCPECGVKRG